MKLTTEQIEEAERGGLVLPERALHTVEHFGKQYQWFRRADGQLVMRPAGTVTVLEDGRYEIIWNGPLA